MPGLRIIHTNDLHGQLTEARMAQLLSARAESDLYFDSGDAIKSGNLAVPLVQDPVWERLRRAGTTASVPGNRESHVLEASVRAKFKGLDHPVVCANWFDKSGKLRFPASTIVTAKGLKIGVFGVMVPIVTDRMASRATSQFLWQSPVECAREPVALLRSTCDVVIALTHIGHRQDQLLAEKVPGIDIIFGGHSHTVLASPEQIGQTWVAQDGSHGRFIGRYVYDKGVLTGGPEPWSVSS